MKTNKQRHLAAIRSLENTKTSIQAMDRALRKSFKTTTPEDFEEITAAMFRLSSEITAIYVPLTELAREVGDNMAKQNETRKNQLNALGNVTGGPHGGH